MKYQVGDLARWNQDQMVVRNESIMLITKIIDDPKTFGYYEYTYLETGRKDRLSISSYNSRTTKLT
jgi:hypothetical protein